VEFEEFVAARAPALLRTAHLLTGSHHEGEDVLQTVLTRMLLHWGKVGGEHPEAYARRALVNAAVNLRQRLRSREFVTSDLPERPAVGPHAAHPEAHAERDEMWRALRRLPPKQRAVIVLRYYEDNTEQEIAHLLNCSVGTVKSQAAKALAKLRIDPSLTQSRPTAEPGVDNEPRSESRVST